MEIKLMNFCRIRDKKTGKVLVLDKVKKVGWEGLTFPGGKVEGKETVYDSCVREVKEETGLWVKHLQYCGILEWIFEGREDRELVFLFDTSDFEGELVKNTSEGEVFWMEEDAFLRSMGKADYFDVYYKIIEEENLKEAHCYLPIEGEVKIHYIAQGGAQYAYRGNKGLDKR